MRAAWFLVFCVGGVLSGCKKEPEPARGSPLLPAAAPAPSAVSPPAQAPSAGSKPESFQVGVTWEDPPGWKRLPKTSAMRKATYTPPRAASDKEDAELAVFYFGPGQGGTVEANIDRWVKQFEGVKPDAVRRDARDANGLRQHTVEIEKGTFASGMPGPGSEPKAGMGLLGGIVEAPSGSYFFKLTGPSDTVKAARPAFMKLLDSVKTAS